MAQERHFNYKADDSTFNLNSRFEDIIPSGVYRGFVPRGDVMQLKLQHTGTGEIVNLDKTKTENVGIILSRQGVIIRETEEIVLSIDTNETATERVDLVVMEHSFVESIGGVPATYMVIKGIEGAGIPSMLNNVQVPICWVSLPAGTTDLSSAEIYKYPTPDLGKDSSIAHTDRDETFEELLILEKGLVLENETWTNILFENSTSISGDISPVSDIISPLYKMDNAGNNVISNIAGVFLEQPFGWSFKVLFLDRIKIFGRDASPSGNILMTGFSNDEGFEYIQVEKNEIVEFTKINNTGLNSSWDDVTWIAKLNSSRHGNNKYTATQVFNQGSSFGIGANKIALKSDGNYLKITSPSSSYNVNEIKAFKSSGKGGTQIYIEIEGTNSINFKHNQTAGTDYKNIRTFTGEDIVLEAGTVVKFIELETEWLLLEWHNSNKSKDKALGDRDYGSPTYIANEQSFTRALLELDSVLTGKVQATSPIQEVYSDTPDYIGSTNIPLATGFVCPQNKSQVVRDETMRVMIYGQVTNNTGEDKIAATLINSSDDDYKFCTLSTELRPSLAAAIQAYFYQAITTAGDVVIIGLDVFTGEMWLAKGTWTDGTDIILNTYYEAYH